MGYSKNQLVIDAENEIKRISSFIERTVRDQKKDGVVVGLSGGIDSAVTSALSVVSLGSDRVFGVIIPEKESNPISRRYAIEHAEKMGIEYEEVDITPVLETFGTYDMRDRIISGIFADYDPSIHMIKIVLPEGLLDRDSFNFFTLIVDDGEKEIHRSRLRKRELNGIIAATDSKQRTRMMTLYHRAESKNRLVCGTTNRPEMMQGFFVKYGDGGVDLEPLAHLYKAQVYQIGRALGVPDSILDRMPSPDTFTSKVGDEEFFFKIPYHIVDMLLYSWENEVPLDQVSEVMNLDREQIERVYRDFTSKYNTTKPLRSMPPDLLD
ncbi:MAG: NAD(+) synthase [Thermoplasmata archaeon]|nr:NAD(+) synthase [Thermoplasmata archaeon]